MNRYRFGFGVLFTLAIGYGYYYYKKVLNRSTIDKTNEENYLNIPFKQDESEYDVIKKPNFPMEDIYKLSESNNKISYETI